MFAAIDLDSFIYRVGFATQKRVYDLWQGAEYTRYASLEEAEAALLLDGDGKIEPAVAVEAAGLARYNLKSMIKRAITGTNATEYKIYLTGKDNFRLKIDPEYKAHRKDAERPVHYAILREYAVENWGAKVIDGMEADDAVSIVHMRRYSKNPESSMICSNDKDLLGVPGYHYNYVSQETIFVSPLDSLRNYFAQVLAGDAADNVKGIPGIGPKKAAKALAPCHTGKDMLHIVKEAYKEAGMEAKLETNLKLLWMLREKGDSYERWI